VEGVFFNFIPFWSSFTYSSSNTHNSKQQQQHLEMKRKKNQHEIYCIIRFSFLFQADIIYCALSPFTAQKKERKKEE